MRIEPGKGASTRVVLFDLGGVLVELGGVDHFGQLIGVGDHEEIWRRWLRSPWVRRYESGVCSREDFSHGMVEEHALSLPADEFLDVFRSWPRGLFEGAVDLVESLVPEVRSACLSNTNELHWKEQRDARHIQILFEERFLSHETGLLKPDGAVFEHVVEVLGCQPAEVLFFDDNTLNIEAALAAGLDAHRVMGVSATRDVLIDRGLLERRR